MSTYQVADGYDNEAGFANVNPQPMSEGIKATRRSHGGDGSVYDEGKYVELVFTMLPDVTTYQSVLNQFGVQSALTNAVTVKVRDETLAFVNMNGTAVRPEPGRDMSWSRYFPRNVTILVKSLLST